MAWTALLILALSAAGRANAVTAADPPSGAATVTLELVNGLSGEALAGQRVDAKRVVGNGFEWAARATTDGQGKAVFQLDGLDNGISYVFFARPYNGGWAQSQPVSAYGALRFPVGMLPVQVVAGGNGEALADTPVTLYQRMADGSKAWRKSGRTDDQGRIVFDPVDLGHGGVYVLGAKSIWDGSNKYSADIGSPGPVRFEVGNAPLQVTLRDAIGGGVLPSLAVVAYEILADGSRKWRKRRTSDASGLAIFDLDGLGDGRRYQLGAKPYNGGAVYSPDLTATGPFQFRVGTVELRVVDGASGGPLTETRVDAKVLGDDGKYHWAKRGTSDDQGVIRFDLSGLGQGKTYLFEARSPADGSRKRSAEITREGVHHFRVGNKPLTVTVANAITGEPLEGLKVTAYERLADGSLKWRARHTTDQAGFTLFDLDGLGDGRNYVLSAKPYNGGTVYSPDLEKAGPFRFLVGSLEVSVTSGADGSPLAGHRVKAIERVADGTLKGRKSGTTDEQGVIRFDLSGLGDGRTYLLEAQSPVDGSRKRGPDLTAPGRVDFVVGNAALVVKLVDASTGSGLAGVRIDAREPKEGGGTRWVAKRTTDEQGRALFDLDGLGSGRDYLLQARPFNGGNVYSPLLTASGDYLFRVGTLPVTLSDGDSGRPIAGQRISAYRKFPDGRLKGIKSGTSDAQGVVRFDLESLREGGVYVFKTSNAFGLNKRYYSPLVTAEGPLDFVITADGEYGLDRHPPQVAVLSPMDGDVVGGTGFTLSGVATDREALDRVVIDLDDPIKGGRSVETAADPDSGAWSVVVPGAWISEGETLAIRVTAIDTGLNEASATLAVAVVADAEAPLIGVDSHSDGDQVPVSGFLLSGSVSDDTGVTGLTASLYDGSRLVYADAPVDVSVGGRWTLAVSNGQVGVGSTARIGLAASDAVGHLANLELSLEVIAADHLPRHLLHRISFGVTPEALEEIEALGAAEYLDRQLNPASIDDSAMDTLAASLHPTTKAELRAYELAYASVSRRQLREVMTWFWDNHFNTDFNKHKVVAYEVAENDQFRTHALGRFRDLLGISAHSPAMLIYLDNVLSDSDDPNENYARELLELFTMGVDGGYTQQDVVELARVLTGWVVSEDGRFVFDSDLHDSGDKVVLGNTIPGGGLSEGEQVLDILAAHPGTARFICFKLSQVFVADGPPDGLVGRCADTFLANVDSADQMAVVVRMILESPEFGDQGVYLGKLKTPLEFAVGLVRNLATAAGADLAGDIRSMGQRLFENPVPTGWSETGDDWINSNLLLARIRFANGVARTGAGGSNTGIDPVAFFQQQGYETAGGIVDYLFDLVFDGRATELEREHAMDILEEADGFELLGPDADARLRRLLGTVLSYPAYQYQ